MTSILAAICRISHNNFKRHYLRNKRLFLDFLLHFWNVDEIKFRAFLKKDLCPSLIISEIIDGERRDYLNV